MREVYKNFAERMNSYIKVLRKVTPRAVRPIVNEMQREIERFEKSVPSDPKPKGMEGAKVEKVTLFVDENVKGIEQEVYYYVVDPNELGVERNGINYVLIHGGGYHVGSATYELAMAKQLALKGFTVVIPEYRRGWADDDTVGASQQQLGSKEAQLFQRAVSMAIGDVKACLRHFKEHNVDNGDFQNRFLFGGDSAGSSLACYMALVYEPNFSGRDGSSSDRGPLTTEGFNVVGLIVNWGTYAGFENWGPIDFPICINAGLFDVTQPAYNDRLFYNVDMQATEGPYAMYERLKDMGTVDGIFFAQVQNGHGAGPLGRELLNEQLEFIRGWHAGTTGTGMERVSVYRKHPETRAPHYDMSGAMFSPYEEMLRDGQDVFEVAARIERDFNINLPTTLTNF